LTRINGRTKVGQRRAPVMTGYSGRMDELAALDVVVLAKPFAPSALLAAIASLGPGTSVT
jgi:hypothetical protein